MDWPEVNEHFLITSLGDRSTLATGGISAVTLLGAKEPPDWKLTPQGLRIRRPDVRPCDGAYAFKIELHGTVVEKVAAQRIDEEQVRVELRLRNLETEPTRHEIAILDNGRVVGRETFDMKPAETVSRDTLVDAPRQEAIETITAAAPGGKPFIACDELIGPPAMAGGCRFDGKTRFAVSDLGKHERLTISLWARADTLNRYSALLNTNGWAPGGMHVQYVDDNVLEVALHGPKGPVNCRARLEPAKAGPWRMITVTYGEPAGHCKVYMNAKLAAEAASEAFPVDLNAFALGGWDRESRPLVGQMANIRIYGRILSADEVRGLLRGQASTEGLLAAWDCAETGGNVIQDISGHGHHAARIK